MVNVFFLIKTKQSLSHLLIGFRSKNLFRTIANFALSDRSRQKSELRPDCLFLYILPLLFLRVIEHFATARFASCIRYQCSDHYCAQNGEVFNPYSLSLATRKFDLKNVIRRLLRLNGVRYDACQPHPLSEIPLRSPCIGRFQTHIQTSACKY